MSQGGGIADVRRRDRGKDDGWIAEFLGRAPFGFLATVEDGQPFLNSNLFVYDPDKHAIFLHTARTGRTPGLLADPRRVAFSAAVVGRLLPADEALEFSVEYASVVAFGTGRTLQEPDAKRRALQLLLDRYAPRLRPGRDYRAITDDELRRTAVYRVDTDTWSGKEKAAPEDHPGALALPLPGIPVRTDGTGTLLA